jgi:dephospho-CoA kinase
MTPPEKPFVIGIVGNIGAGKSLVRKMLERLGGLGIDADALAHRTLLKGSPVYQKVIAQFGSQLLNAKGEIERQKLASLVFSNKENLLILENLIHPAVEAAGRQIISQSTSPFVVIEAIKLLESDLVDECDSIWLVNVPIDTQIERVMQNRGMTREQVLQRVEHQSLPEIKLHSAHVVIDNGSGPEFTWKQVNAVFSRLVSDNPKLGRTLDRYQEWKNLNRSLRFLQPTNSILLKKIVETSQPVGWVNHWINSAAHRDSEKMGLRTRSSYFDMLVKFQCFLHQPDKTPELLSVVNIENFILQPLYLFTISEEESFDIKQRLDEIDLIANQRLCEAVIFPISKKASTSNGLLLENGYTVLSPDEELFDIWKTEVARTGVAGYNVMSKIYRKTIRFDLIS